MAKPWAKVQIGRMRHAKFLALNGNAISLWDEIKDYCDEHHTDGLVPLEAFKTFRFAGKKSMQLLTTSCGPKPDGRAFAPLLEPHPVGFKMHDYLDHNDCRDEVLARIGDADDVAELRKIANKERQIRYRAERKAKLAALKNGGNSVGCERPISDDVPKTGLDRRIDPDTRNADVTSVTRDNERDSTRDITRTCSTPTETTTETETIKREGETPAASRPRPQAPIHDRSHLKHAVCGRVCLHAAQYGEFVRRRNHDNAEAEVRTWAERIVDAWTMGPFAAVEPGDPFEFWRTRYAETWPAANRIPAPASNLTVHTTLSPAMAARLAERQA